MFSLSLDLFHKHLGLKLICFYLSMFYFGAFYLCLILLCPSFMFSQGLPDCPQAFPRHLLSFLKPKFSTYFFFVPRNSQLYLLLHYLLFILFRPIRCLQADKVKKKKTHLYIVKQIFHKINQCNISFVVEQVQQIFTNILQHLFMGIRTNNQIVVGDYICSLKWLLQVLLQDSQFLQTCVFVSVFSASRNFCLVEQHLSQIREVLLLPCTVHCFCTLSYFDT